MSFYIPPNAGLRWLRAAEQGLEQLDAYNFYIGEIERNVRLTQVRSRRRELLQSAAAGIEPYVAKAVQSLEDLDILQHAVEQCYAHGAQRAAWDRQIGEARAALHYRLSQQARVTTLLGQPPVAPVSSWVEALQAAAPINVSASLSLVPLTETIGLPAADSQRVPVPPQQPDVPMEDPSGRPGQRAILLGGVK